MKTKNTKSKNLSASAQRKKVKDGRTNEHAQHKRYGVESMKQEQMTVKPTTKEIVKSLINKQWLMLESARKITSHEKIVRSYTIKTRDGELINVDILINSQNVPLNRIIVINALNHILEPNKRELPEIQIFLRRN